MLYVPPRNGKWDPYAYITPVSDVPSSMNPFPPTLNIIQTNPGGMYWIPRFCREKEYVLVNRFICPDMMRYKGVSNSLVRYVF